MDVDLASVEGSDFLLFRSPVLDMMRALGCDRLKGFNREQDNVGVPGKRRLLLCGFWWVRACLRGWCMSTLDMVYK